MCSSDLFLLAGLLLLVINLRALGQDILAQRAKRQDQPQPFLGLMFDGLQDILKDAEAVGYLTDRDLDDQINALRFAQAQYTLAPVILDKETARHEFVLIDGSGPAAAQALITEHQLQPLRRNQFGIILARNPRPQGPRIRRP